jgi:ABC-type multidrug transport system ATPase subunit
MADTTIRCVDIGHRFGSKILFKGLNYEFEKGNAYSILGNNGTGKSTLIKILMGVLTPSKGKVVTNAQDPSIALVAPYLNLYDELTLYQHLDLIGVSKNLSIIQAWGLHKAAQESIDNYSSGMKQRAKFVLAEHAANTEVYFLDEPHSNLDSEGTQLVQEKINSWVTSGKCVIIGSNDNNEYRQALFHLNLEDYQ